MKRASGVRFGFVAVLILGLTASVSWAVQGAAKAKVELPAAVAKVVKDNCPNKEIDTVTVEKTAGVALYDIEFKGTQGEIEIAEDGTVIDIATVITMQDVPKAAADVIRKHAQGAQITRVERSDVRAEVKTEGGKGAVVEFATPKVVYEAELAKGKQTAEIQVAPDGAIVEAPKWGAKRD
jgi:hypothetical protein